MGSANKLILFLSTTPIWGGSEVLWSYSARELKKDGYRVHAGLQYPQKVVERFIDPGEYLNFLEPIRPPNLALRILQKLKVGNYPPRNLFREHFRKVRPDLVIISQGNNTEGYLMMKACIEFSIPFITLTHLVTFDFWPAMNDERINEFIKLYQSSALNLFVSNRSMHFHNQMLGTTLTNSEVVYNPFTKNVPDDFTYPCPHDKGYKIALVGRIESFHKGYDILIDVIKADKWKQRPVKFSLFGTGPHVDLLQRLLTLHDIRNFNIYNYVEDVAEIWKEHQILLMPSRMEGQSLSLIEAMRFGRAAIATDVGGTRELVEDGITGFLAPYPTTESIDDALERAWMRKDEWEQIGKNAAFAIAGKHPADPLKHFNSKLKSIIG